MGIILEIHCKDVMRNVTLTVIVLKLKNVYNSNVWLPAEKEPVATTPTVSRGIIVPTAPVLMTSWETLELDVTQNVPDTTNVPITRHVSNSSARIPAESLIQMYAAAEPTVKLRIINQSALVPEDLLVIHSCLVASSPGKICVLPILVVLEPLVSLEVTGLDQTGLFVLVPLDSEETLWYLVQEESVKMMLNVPLAKHVLTLSAKTLVKMLVELELNVSHSTMGLSVLVLMVTLETR